MNRQQLLARIGKAWAELHESYAGLSEARLHEVGVTSHWSVRDILAHVTVWEEEALKSLPLVAEGTRPPTYSVTYGGIDAFNALMTQRDRGLSLEQVLARMNGTHERLLRYLADVPEVLFTDETQFRSRLRLDTYGHYRVHAKAIQAWRERTV